ncbi:hypothetical protein [Streptomyces sp. NPDC007905]|uniref:hypothetical protein n=1 Tax=Streptomyces sp. NPDC007905 TaxID=3364788 RepID=UPI0036E958AB
MEAAPADHPDRAMFLNSPGNSLGTRFKGSGALARLPLTPSLWASHLHFGAQQVVAVLHARRSTARLHRRRPRADTERDE